MPDTGIIRSHKQASPLSRRTSTSKRCDLPNRDRPLAMAPTNRGIRRQANCRRTLQKRHHPLPEKIRCTRNLSSAHARPPNTQPGLRHLKSASLTYRNSTQMLICEHTKKILLTYRGVNAGAESFFATLKRELIYRYQWNDPKILHQDLYWWIEAWYNNQRTHTTLGATHPKPSTPRPLPAPRRVTNQPDSKIRGVHHSFVTNIESLFGANRRHLLGHGRPSNYLGR